MSASHPTATLHDGRQVRLGRIKPKSRPQALRLGNYVDLAAADLPASVDYSPKAMESIKHMYLNDRYGDCVIASLGHSIGVWSGNDGDQVVTATDQEISNIYFFFSPRDQGCVITQVLDYWQHNGLTIGGKNHQIDGYAALNWTDPNAVKFGIKFFGSVEVGFNLPNQWANSEPSVPWAPTRSRIVGGHDVLAVGYNDTGVIISTWGGLRTWTWEAFCSQTWIDEAYVRLSPDWYGADKISGSGLDVAKLQADLALISGGQIPPIVPDPVTPPTPDPVPVPIPVPPAPVVTGLTLEQTIQAINDGVGKGGPYSLFNANVKKVTQAAILGVQDAYPRHNRSPLPSEIAEEILGGK